ncbi:MAG: phosphopantothenoylcysteine decarboxylase [Limisphaerales bacterium]
MRRLTNFSTGRLGTELANFLVARGHHVTLLIGAQATYGGECTAQRVETFTTTADLRSRIESRAAVTMHGFFHAAAVSDFAFGKIQLQLPKGELTEVKSKKISTRDGTLLAELVPTPKIIKHLRGWFPQAKLVGWKFEADGARADAIAVALKQIADCHTDACVANGPAYGAGFGLITNASQTHLADDAALFATLEKFIRA